ncbi:hypothetical protein [Aequorivita echinoideorum]|uniref:Secreted protein n=1 Tax=Aequorivita echinoideorum TaxID=1549647 RepID=A0ABS5S429_9FLAO|nr:hypothetical protein [Aequorivita echinoideorum]MBT0607970.1 hypothetical protein [Aequorivita echinoideorum]
MKKYIVVFLLLFASNIAVFAQFETSNSTVKFNSNETNTTGSSFEIPASKRPTLTNLPSNTSNSTLGQPEEPTIDFKNGDGLIEYTGTNKAPKYFSKDKEEKPEYGKDDYLGDFKTKAGKVTFMYRDHEYVDGDLIRIYVNGKVGYDRVRLEGAFRGFELPLESGFNKVDFEALNQGSSGPNTAQLQVFDETGNLLASYEWNLLTGNKATAIVVKE